jgi:dTDP-4-dehydrorhamnose 3,5-epimerase
MRLRDTGIPGAYVVELDPRRDERGSFMRTYCRDEFARLGLASDFVQANAGTSAARGTLRGLHHQLPPHAEAKTIRCTRGAVFDVVVDARPESPAYLAWYGVELRGGEPFLVYVPEGCAHGYLTLEDDTEIAYQTSSAYAPEAERGIHYADPAVGIRWPAPIAVVSDRDRAWPLLAPEAVTP